MKGPREKGKGGREKGGRLLMALPQTLAIQVLSLTSRFLFRFGCFPGFSVSPVRVKSLPWLLTFFGCTFDVWKIKGIRKCVKPIRK